MVNNSVLFFILLLHCYCRPCIQRNGFVSPLRVHFEWIHTQTHYKYSSTKPGNCQEISFALHSECKHCQHLVSYSSVVLIVYSSKLLIIRYLNLFASHVNVILTYYRLIFNLKKKKKKKQHLMCGHEIDESSFQCAHQLNGTPRKSMYIEVIWDYLCWTFKFLT